MTITIENNGEKYVEQLNGSTIDPVVAVNTTLHLLQQIYTPYHISYVLRHRLDQSLLAVNKTHFLH